MDKQSLTICLISTGFYPHDGGGIGTYSYNLAQGLSAQGHKVIVITQTKEEDTVDQIGAVTVYRFKSRYYPQLEKLIPGLAWSRFVARQIDELNQKYHFDVIEFPNWEGVGYCYVNKKNRKPVVIRLHTPYFETLAIDQGNHRMKLSDRFICWLEKQSCLKSDRLVSSTECHKTMMKEQYHLDEKKVTILPLGIGTNSKNVGRIEDKSEKIIKILYVSRLEHRKGTMVLLQCIPELLAKHANIDFVIIGKDRPHAPDGRYHKEYFEQTYAHCKGKVLFLGYVSNEELEQYYTQADIFVVPSLYESFGLIYVEAMMKGKAVIGTKAGGIPEVIKDGETGILVQPESVEDLYRAVELLIAHEDLRQNLGRLAKVHAEKEFNTPLMAQRSAEHYRQAIKECRFHEG
ncbi:MAG: glycosyltransferase family 4 protein [Candidatus Omnitrophica bacterium]|nr:glycosyltransferase family 4 protein [Candidatus Omnitrophota bacterium]MCB9746951.1 glycosyltransferase family 4 protein [Candidatus Omnitrophota bacterium]